MTMITPSYLGETIEYSSLHACRSTLEDPTRAHSVLSFQPSLVRYYGANATSGLAERSILRRDEKQQPDTMRPETASR